MCDPLPDHAHVHGVTVSGPQYLVRTRPWLRGEFYLNPGGGGGSVLVLNLNDMGRWFNMLSTWSVEVIGEADCKEQFNNVHPKTVIKHMWEAAAWLKQRRRWRAATFGWSIHKEHKHLDRDGEAKKSNFDFLPLDCLIELVEFSLLTNNVVVAASEPWRRGGGGRSAGLQVSLFSTDIGERRLGPDIPVRDQP